MKENSSGPYSLGFLDVSHRDATVRTIFNSKQHDNLLQNMESLYTYEVVYVPQGYQHRPDLISNVFYGSPKYWWLLMLVNNISDPFEGFYLDQKIMIPKL